jgi:copper/silver efflux system protein
MTDENHSPAEPRRTWVTALVSLCLRQKVVVVLLTTLLCAWGLLVAPFDWQWGAGLRQPLPVDALPDIGENQQIVFTTWPGRSPQDVEDQITYPLTVSLLGLPGVASVRSSSQFGFSAIYIIFGDEIDFYWARSRILEKLSSLDEDALPDGVRPMLGPDATALGQVFWYTLEGRDADGRPAGGWDLHELRTVQDYYVRYALQSVQGVSEVASVGGFVQEYQIDLDPDRMRINQVSLGEVIAAIKDANRDVGARAIEVNRVEYLIRGMGFVHSAADLENAVIKMRGDVPIFVRTVARTSLGPAYRQGALDKGGAEAVGGVVVVRHGENPLAVIEAVRTKIDEILPGMPRKTLADGRQSQVTVVPFYDRTTLINETLATLQKALTQEVLITILVVVVMLRLIGNALVVAALLPLAVLMTFVAMHLVGVNANIVALAGIAIAIGTLVDMGVVITEAITRKLAAAPNPSAVRTAILAATSEVGGAVVTALATTVVGFLPVFALTGAEGRLFRPLALTKSFALIAALVVAVCVLPVLLEWVYRRRPATPRRHWLWQEIWIYLGAAVAVAWQWQVGLLLVCYGLFLLLRRRLPAVYLPWLQILGRYLLVAVLGVGLAIHWLPLGTGSGILANILFIGLVLTILLGGYHGFQVYYPKILGWCLDHKSAFLMLPGSLVLLGLIIWLGLPRMFNHLPRGMRESQPLQHLAEVFPGLGKEFMPPLDEGSYLLMPTTMPHASIGEVLDILRRQDLAIGALPEVATVVGKLGRAESALDPAPVSMIETLITYRPEFAVDEGGNLLKFRYTPDDHDLARDMDGFPVPAPDGRPYAVHGKYLRDGEGRLIPAADGKPFRHWRPALDPRLNPERRAWPGIRRPDDIWNAITEAARLPGTTGASKLQPISARLVMLQSGIRAPMGIKIKGPDLATIEATGRQIEVLLREVPQVAAHSVVADRIIAKPYLEIHVDRQAIAQHGINLAQVLDVIEYAIGGRRITTSVQGRERYPIRVRYLRELRDDLESIDDILVPAPAGFQIPLGQLARVHYAAGPQAIRGEDGFLVGYVLFDMQPGQAEVQVVDAARAYLDEMVAIGRLQVPPGVSYSFTGSYENQVRSEKRLLLILPLALAIIFTLLYLQFGRVSTSALVFSGIAVAWSGGFILLWLYGQSWFLGVAPLGVDLRAVFNLGPVNLSVAVWVGFLALFGIATDDGVVMATRLTQANQGRNFKDVAEIRTTIVTASQLRVRACLMTTATTVIALLPVLTANGRGADLMKPMAIPSVGGMLVEVVTVLMVPVLYSAMAERRWRLAQRSDRVS